LIERLLADVEGQPGAGLMKAPDVLAVLALSGFFDYVALLTAGGPR
jgi:hypothetical protein